MATFAYALRTEQREASPPGTSENTGKPGSTTWLDAVAALVPAEVLAIHALVLNWTTETIENENGDKVTTITDPGALKVAFWGLTALAAGIYVVRKLRAFDRWDVARMLFPPVAFVLWTMLQPSTAFDAQFPDLSENIRYIVAVIVAAFIAAAAKQLGKIADEKGE